MDFLAEATELLTDWGLLQRRTEAGAQQLGATAATIAGVAPGGGQGEWVFPADSGAEKSLGIVIPADAGAGTFSSTLTFTTAPPA